MIYLKSRKALFFEMIERITSTTSNRFFESDFPERESQILFPGVDVIASESYNNRLVVEGFIEGNPGRVFTVADMVSELPFYISPETCHDILRRCGLIERLTKENKFVRYVSKAPRLETVFDDGDSLCGGLGKQAREDYYELIRERSLCIRKRFRVITKF